MENEENDNEFNRLLPIMRADYVGKGSLLHPIKVIDYKPHPIDTFKHNWHIYEVTVRLSDNSEATGFCQGDGHDLWALETFEAD